MGDRNTQPAEERRPTGHGLLYVGVVMAVPAVVYLAMTAFSGDRAAEPSDSLMPVVMPFVYGSALLALVCFGVSVFAFVRFRRSRARHVAVAAAVWLCGAAAYAYTAHDFASGLERISGLWRW